MISVEQTDDLSLVLGRDITLAERELATGGEGKIYRIKEDPLSVAKIFHKPSPEKAEKIDAMLANPPDDPAYEETGHISIAWPTARILDAGGRCCGFAMPYINPQDSFPLLKVYNPQDRLQTVAEFTWQYLMRIALNLASIVKELHKKGYIIGDLNESNVIVTTRALVTLVDCDSIQVLKYTPDFWGRVRGKKREYFRCTVGKPEYTPPELQGRDFSQFDRKKQHDNFGLAILIFLLLMEGRHPFSGVWRGKGSPPTLPQSIKNGYFPYLKSGLLVPPPHALPFTILPTSIQDLMISCFVDHHHQATQGRPTANAWYMALKKSEKHLIPCKKNSAHMYDDHLEESCPWCKRAKLGNDPFPQQTRTRIQQRPRIRIVHAVKQYAIVLLMFVFLAATYFGEYRFWPYYSHWLGPVLEWTALLFGPIVLCLFLYRRFWDS